MQISGVQIIKIIDITHRVRMRAEFKCFHIVTCLSTKSLNLTKSSQILVLNPLVVTLLVEHNPLYLLCKFPAQ